MAQSESNIRPQLQRWRQMKYLTLAEKCCNIQRYVPVAPEYIFIPNIEDIKFPGKYIDANGDLWDAK